MKTHTNMQILLCLLLATALVVLAGCSSEPDVTTVKSSTGTPVDASEEIGEVDATATTLAEPDTASSASTGKDAVQTIQEKISDNLNVDLEYAADGQTEAAVQQVEFVVFDEQAVQAALFPDDEVSVDHYEVPSSTTVLSVGDISARFSTGPTWSSLVCFSPFADKIFNTVSLEPDQPDMGLERYMETESVPFASPNEISSRFEELLKDVGIGNAGDFRVYALDHSVVEAVQEQRKAEAEDPTSSGGKARARYNDEWTESDDCYIVAAKCLYDDIPVNTLDTTGPADEYAISGTLAVAMYSASGLESLRVSSFMDPVSAGEEEPLIPVDEALATVTTKLGDLITDYTHTVTGAQLIYAPRPKGDQLELIPAWNFTVEETGTDEETGNPWEMQFNQLIDARTGAELLSADGDWQ